MTFTRHHKVTLELKYPSRNALLGLGQIFHNLRPHWASHGSHAITLKRTSFDTAAQTMFAAISAATPRFTGWTAQRI
jgi:hypothetical protein